MKKIVLLFLINFMAAISFAQLNTNLILSTTPTALLSDWANRKDVLTYIVSPSGLLFQVKIKTELKLSDGTVIGTTDLAKAKIYTAGNANLILTALDVMPLEIMLFTGKYKSTFDKTGKLPADNYQLCVQLVAAVDYRALSEIKCKFFNVAALQLPVLMKPYNDEALDTKIAQTAITFRWTPLIPKTTTIATYHLQVFEVQENQTPMQSLRSSQPLLDVEVKGATQYIWRPQINFSTAISADSITPAAQQKGKAFIWTIQTLDNQGLPVLQTEGNGESRSEPIIFYVNPGGGNPALKQKKKATKGLKDTLKTQV